MTVEVEHLEIRLNAKISKLEQRIKALEEQITDQLRPQPPAWLRDQELINLAFGGMK